jgi:signal transduction histidine kinase/ligand-binding sensor domain-containing protein
MRIPGKPLRTIIDKITTLARSTRSNSAVNRIVAAPLLIVLILSLSPSVWGVDPDRYISQYRHSAWRMKDGLLRGEPNVITQTPDGYIWIGTTAGLMRFDGVRLAPWKPPDGSQLPSPNIRALLAARDGSLWIGTDAGLSHWSHQNLVTYLKEPALISAILEDQRGGIWVTRMRVSNAHGPLCQVSGSKSECYAVPDETSIGNCCVGLVEDSLGNLWTGAGTALLRWRDGSVATYPNKNLKNAGTDGVIALASAPNESLWVGIADAGPGLGLEQFEQDGWKPFRERNLDGSKLAVGSLLVDREHALWIGTFDQGIYRIHGNRVDHFNAADGLSSKSVWSFYQDREGNIWVATSEGVDCFRDIPVVSFSTEEGLTADDVVSVLSTRDGTVWVGNGGSLDAIRDGMVSSIRTGKGLPGNQVTSLLEDRAGRLWVGLDNKLYVYQNRHFTKTKRADGGDVGTVAGMTEDGEGNIWAVTIAPSRRLVRIRDFKVIEEMQAPRIPNARALAADRQAGIWLGLMNGDLARYRNGATEIFTFHHDPNQRVRQVIVNSDNSVLGATGVGLIGWKDGRLQTMTVSNGLPCDNIFSVLPDGKNFWLYAQCGLVMIAADQMQQWWEQPKRVLQVNVIDQFDGVRPQSPVFSPPASRSGDGKLWFANNSVLQMFDAAHTRNNSIVPPVHIEQIIADRRTYPPDSGLALPASVRSLELDYTAPSFVLPEMVRFRYKLEGHDADWQDAGTRRQAFYSSLPPGRYRFHVIASNNDGVWNEEGAWLELSVAPAWYQRSSMQLLCVLVGALLVWGLYQMRIRQVAHQFNLSLEARVSERTRIARDLHDTLLQSFHGLMFQFQAARNMLPRRPDEAMDVLDSAIGATEQAISESRSAIQQLRSEQIDECDLARWLTNIGQELARSQQTNGDSPTFRLTVEGEQQSLSPLPRTEVYRITREILQNAFRHAQAHHIEAEIRYDDGLLRVRIRDDGRGIDPQVLRAGGSAGHWGLRGARERAQQIGARLDFWSEAGAGTEVQLTVPGAVAYEKSRNKRRFRLFRKEQES